MSFSKRAFEELNNKGKSMKEIDIDVANKLAKKVVLSCFTLIVSASKVYPFPS